VVLDLDELFDQIALMMIVSDAQNPYANFIFVFAVQRVANDLFAYQIADKFAARKILFGNDHIF